MSYEIVKKWLDDPTSVTEEEVDNAYQAMFSLQPNGANQNLMAALSYINDSETSDSETVAELLSRYEAQK